MDNIKSVKSIAVIATTLFCVSILALTIGKGAYTSLQDRLNEERLRSESLLSEKLLLDKKVGKLAGSVHVAENRNSGLQDSLATVLATAEADSKLLRVQDKLLRKEKNKKAELAALKKRLAKELDSVKAECLLLQQKNYTLNSTLATTEARNTFLETELYRESIASLDRTQLQAVKKNDEKLTVKASKTRKFITSFDAPAALQNLHFKVFDPDGRELNSKDGEVAFRVLPTPEMYVASLAKNQASAQQTVQMVFVANEKLQSGIYRVEILNNELYVGSLQVKLL